MLDVHALHKKLSGAKEMFIHLFVITLGLLIATQIEACQEWRHHVHLAAEARAALRTEIEHNLSEMKDAQTRLKAWREETDRNFTAMKKIQDNPKDPAAQKTSVNISLNIDLVNPHDTAWRTAQTTGALAYMPYDEAQRYVEIYKEQAQLLSSADVPVTDVSTLTGMIARFHWNDKSPITEEQASEMAGKLTELKVHLMLSDLLLQVCIDGNSAFLEGRKPKDSFTEPL